MTNRTSTALHSSYDPVAAVCALCDGAEWSDPKAILSVAERAGLLVVSAAEPFAATNSVHRAAAALAAALMLSDAYASLDDRNAKSNLLRRLEPKHVDQIVRNADQAGWNPMIDRLFAASRQGEASRRQARIRELVREGARKVPWAAFTAAARMPAPTQAHA